MTDCIVHEDVTVAQVSVLLKNLSFSTLVEPFRSNGMSGVSISMLDAYEEVC